METVKLSHLYLKLTLPLLLFFTTAATIIHTQPYRDPQMQEILAADLCTMPCFLGIRPGLTTFGEALDILEANAWVGNVEPYAIAPGTSYTHVRGWAYWDWRADAPIWFRGTSPILGVHSGAFETLDGIVNRITVATNIPFGRFWLASSAEAADYQLGFSLVVTAKAGVRSAVLRYWQGFLQNDVEMPGNMVCRSAWNIWFMPSAITILSSEQNEDDVRFVVNQPPLSVTHDLERLVCSRR
jgi:hypothetical protein